MRDPEEQGVQRATPVKVPDLLDDYRRQQEALTRQADEVARLRGEVLAAADREALSVIATARGEVRRLVVQARRELLGLADQVAAINRHGIQPSDDADSGEFVASSEAGARTCERLLAARHELRRVLDETRPDLRALREQARMLRFPSASRTDDPAREPEGSGEPRPELLDKTDAIVEPPVDLPAAWRDREKPLPALEAATRAVETSRGSSEMPIPAAATSPSVDSMPAFQDEAHVAAPGAAAKAAVWAPEHLEAAARTFSSIREKAAVEWPRSDPAQMPRRSANTWVASCAVLGLVVVLGTAWWVSTRAARSGPRRSESAQGAATRAASPPPPADRSTHRAAAAVSAPATENTAASGAAGAPASDAAGKVSVLITAQRRTWIRTTVDGRPDAGRTYDPGETKTVVGSRGVTLRAGDAGALAVSVNGGAPKLLGRDGEVVTKEFAPATASTASAKPAVSQVVPGQGPAGLTGSSAASTPDVGPQLTSAARRWLDAYYKKDSGVMTSLEAKGAKVSDERLADERLPAGLDARRSLERVTFQFVGDSAILTARMTEQASSRAQVLQHAAWISQVWIRESGQWRLMDVRLLSDSKLK